MTNSTLTKAPRKGAGAAAAPPSKFNSVSRALVRPFKDPRFLPVFGTIFTLLLMLAVGNSRYGSDARPFVSPRLFTNLLIDNAYLLVLAVGMTFVIITGGIDLSVGAVVALVGLVVAKLLIQEVPLPLVLILGVLIGSVFGLGIGIMVQVFKIQPFIASLAGLFLARGLANVVSVESIGITDSGFAELAAWKLQIGTKNNLWAINLSGVIAILVLVIAFWILHYTRFGRTVYGIGAGDDGNAANLMGLKADRAKIWVYVISGTCAGIAGILFAFYTKSGFNLTGVGMELDAIAAVVIGGAALAGGSGFILGTAAGVGVYGLIQVMNAREGLDSWWAKVFIGVVLLAFVLLQRLVSSRRK